MNNKEKKRLINSLIKRIQLEKERENTFGKYEVSRKVIKYNPKYLKEEERQQLIALKAFMLSNPHITNEQLSEMIKDKKFKFLAECENRYENFFDDVKNHVGFLIERIVTDRSSGEILNRPLP